MSTDHRRTGFVDEAEITISSGKGGNGCVSFRREKYIPKGGPDGGDGGRGGHVYLNVNDQLMTLADCRNQRIYRAKNGQNGMGKNRYGRQAADVVIDIPPGTRIYDAHSNALIADLTTPDQRYLIATGGEGGLGNSHFKSSRQQRPRYATPGQEGETHTLRLELNIMADVGLLGLPNAGKSTWIRGVSHATPKVAPYPFTTLRPHLGIVETDHFERFTVADIPGLIAGAADGQGLGIPFLKHLSRCRMLLHLVDISSLDTTTISRNIFTIHGELAQYDPALIKKIIWIVPTKKDLVDPEDLNACLTQLHTDHPELHWCPPVDHHDHGGLHQLIHEIANVLSPRSNSAE